MNSRAAARRLAPAVAGCAFAVACASPTVAPLPVAHDLPTPQAASATPAAAPRDPFAVPGVLVPDAPLPAEPATYEPSLLAPLRASASPASLDCVPWTQPLRVVPPACETLEEARAALDWALGVDPLRPVRDERLAALEGCAGFEAGLVRAVRIEGAPVACGDELALPALQTQQSPSPAVAHALLGAAWAARAVRVAARSQKSGGQGGHVHALLREIEAHVVVMPASYGRALGLAGLADAWSKVLPADLEATTRVSLLAVEAWLAQGAGDGPRIRPALDHLAIERGWLAEVDALRLPPVADVPRGEGPDRPVVRGEPVCRHCYDARRRATDRGARWAEELPAYFAARLLEPAERTSPEALAVWARRGALPAAVRAALAGRALAPREAERVAQARLQQGIRFFDRREVDAALRAHAAVPAAERSPEGRLVLAVALGLHGAPVDLGRSDAPPSARDLDLAALDVVGAAAVPRTGDLGAVATFDAAVLRGLELGPVPGTRGALEDERAMFERVLGGGSQPVYARERRDALDHVLRQLEETPLAVSSRRARVVGWPRVRPGAGSWREPNDRIFAAIRAGNVHRTLRWLGHRFAPCLDAGAGVDVRLQLLIERSGHVAMSTASSDPPDPVLESCVSLVARKLVFPQPDMGVWHVTATLR